MIPPILWVLYTATAFAEEITISLTPQILDGHASLLETHMARIDKLSDHHAKVRASLQRSSMLQTNDTMVTFGLDNDIPTDDSQWDADVKEDQKYHPLNPLGYLADVLASMHMAIYPGQKGNDVISAAREAALLREAEVQAAEEKLVADARGTSLEHLQDTRDSQYSAWLQIGTPPQRISVIMDTGSSNIWVLSKFCQDESCLMNRKGEPLNQFDAASSSTYREVSRDQVDIRFATGRLQGFSAKESFWLGNGIEVQQQTCLMITGERGSIFHKFNQFEGIVGLAYPKLGNGGAEMLFDAIIRQKVLKANVMSFYFSKGYGDPGFVSFGNPEGDRRLYDGEIMWAPVVEPYYWKVALEGWYLGDPDVPGTKKVYSGSLILDSGTTWAGAPTAVTQEILGMPTYATHSTTEGLTRLPDWTFRVYCNPPPDRFSAMPVSDTRGRLQPKNTCPLNWKGSTFDIVLRGEDYMTETPTGWEPALMTVDVPSPHGPGILFGQRPTTAYATSYDRDRDTVGFARAKELGREQLMRIDAEAKRHVHPGAGLKPGKNDFRLNPRTKPRTKEQEKISPALFPKVKRKKKEKRKNREDPVIA